MPTFLGSVFAERRPATSGVALNPRTLPRYPVPACPGCSSRRCLHDLRSTYGRISLLAVAPIGPVEQSWRAQATGACREHQLPAAKQRRGEHGTFRYFGSSCTATTPRWRAAGTGSWAWTRWQQTDRRSSRVAPVRQGFVWLETDRRKARAAIDPASRIHPSP